MSDFTVIQDSREKIPYTFSDSVPVEQGTLNTGDYTVKGFEDVFAVERKSLPDLLKSITWERKRFKKEIERGDDFLAFVVMIEVPMKTVLEKDYRRDVHPNAIMGTIQNWEKYHTVEFVWATDRDDAEEATLRLLQKWYDAYQTLYQSS